MSAHLNHYMEQWGLSQPKYITQTPTSHIYLVEQEGEPVILKLLTALGIKDEAAGAIALQHYGGQGAVRLLQHDANAHLLEYADGEDLIPLVDSGADQKATYIIAQVLKQLHRQTTPSSEGLTPLRRWFRSLFQKAKADQSDGQDSIYCRAATVATELLDSAQDEVVLHGDIHHANIRYKDGRGWLAFDPKGLVGERTYDAANTLCNPVHLPQLVAHEERLLQNAHILSQELSITLGRLLAFTFAYACLSASWTLSDGGDPSLALGVAAIVERHL